MVRNYLQFMYFEVIFQFKLFIDVGSGEAENDTSLNLYKDCADRVLMPCDSEEFITVSFFIIFLLFEIALHFPGTLPTIWCIETFKYLLFGISQKKKKFFFWNTYVYLVDKYEPF